jgi:hypothetical protein
LSDGGCHLRGKRGTAQRACARCHGCGFDKFSSSNFRAHGLAANSFCRIIWKELRYKPIPKELPTL